MCNSTQRFLILFLNAPKSIPNLEASIPSFLPLASYREKLLTLSDTSMSSSGEATEGAFSSERCPWRGQAEVKGVSSGWPMS